MKHPLRTGVIIDGIRQQAWIGETIRTLVHRGEVDLRLVVSCCGAPSRAPAATGILGAYAAWDKRRFRPANDALIETDVSWMLEHTRGVDSQLQHADGAAALGEKTVEAISSAGLDVVVSFLAGCPRDLAECKTTYGSWFFEIGDGLPHPGLREVLERRPTTSVRLLTVGKDGNQPLCQCQGSTDTDSWRLNLNTSSWRLGELLKRAVGRVRVFGEHGLHIEDCSQSEHLPKGSPGGLRLAMSAGGAMWRRACDGISWRLYRESWFSALRLLDGEEPMEGIKGLVRLPQPADAFWADPFPVQTDDTTVIFVEEAKHSDRRGRIAVLYLDKDGHVVGHRVAVERPYHMSYPFVFRYEDDFYMIPQATNEGQVEMLRCVDFPSAWEPHSVVLSGGKYSDTSIIEHDGRWWLFTTPGSKGILPLDDLLVFYADNPFGPWVPHKRNPVISDARYARPAGRPFIIDGKLLRPAQDCSYGQYGRAITIREIVTLTEDEFVERDYKRIDPDWMPGLSKTHTFNFAGNLLVLDGCRRRWKR